MSGWLRPTNRVRRCTYHTLPPAMTFGIPNRFIAPPAGCNMQRPPVLEFGGLLGCDSMRFRAVWHTPGGAIRVKPFRGSNFGRRVPR